MFVEQYKGYLMRIHAFPLKIWCSKYNYATTVEIAWKQQHVTNKCHSRTTLYC